MRPTICILDDAFIDISAAREEIVSGYFQDYLSPWDGVTYPGINTTIPTWIRSRLLRHLQDITDDTVEIKALFARVTTEGLNAPHKVHSDKIMGHYSAHLYLSTDWPLGSGTSFWQHVTEGAFHTDATDVARVAKDANDLTQWQIKFLASGRFNRLVVHDARLWHCAEPIGGWGSDAEDGRVVMTCFFNTASGPIDL